MARYDYETRTPFDAIRKTYGLEKEEWEELLESQSGLCAICKKPKASGTGVSRRDNRFRVDHDHKTDVIRGLLCHKCNLGLHYLEDNEWVSAAREYLANHSTGLKIKRDLPDRRKKEGKPCPSGHNDNWGRDSRGSRRCMTCVRDQQRRGRGL